MIHSTLQLYPPKSGRAFVRREKDRYFTFGVMHFDQNSDFKPDEDAAYALIIDDSTGVAVADEKLDCMPPDEEIFRLTDWFKWPRWDSRSPKFPMHMKVNSARFTQAFEHGYTFVSVTRYDPFLYCRDIRGIKNAEYYVDILQGHTKEIQNPGKQISENDPTITCNESSEENSPLPLPYIIALIQMACIWPDAKGNLHTIPFTTKKYRNILDKAQEIKYQFMLGNASKKDAEHAFLVLGENPFTVMQEHHRNYRFNKLWLEYGLKPFKNHTENWECMKLRFQFARALKKAEECGALDSPELHAKLQLISGNQRTPLGHYTQKP